MISKIHLQGWGVFDNFQWPDDLVPLRSKAIIYGWNYSGKTTLSRAVRAVEKQSGHDEYPGASTIFALEDGANATIDGGLRGLTVFNSDYVTENLKFRDGRANSVAIIGEENIERDEELTRLRLVAENAKLEMQAANSEAEAIERRLKATLTATARDHVKARCEWAGAYDQRRFKAVIEEIREGPDLYLLEDEALAANVAVARAADAMSEQPNIEPITWVAAEWHERIERVLERQVTIADPIPELDESPDLSSWLEEGIDHHRARNSCAFCSRQIPEGRLDLLAQHFVGEIEALRTELDRCQTAIEVVEATEPDRPAAVDLYPECREDYEAALREVDRLIEARNAELESIRTSLKAKRDRYMEAIPHGNWLNLRRDGVDAVGQANAVIERHRVKAQSHGERRDSGFTAVAKHEAALFVEAHDYYTTRALEATRRQDAQTARRRMQEADAAVRDLETAGGDAGRGAAAINDALSFLFGGDGIRVVPVDDHVSRIERSGHEAKCLSEGEQTAIAFAHFLATLDDAACPLDERILWIDDPVSSLDAQHVFGIYSLIRERLANARQLVISTHSYEFFALLKQWAEDRPNRGGMGPLFRRDGGQGDWQDPAWSAHLTRREEEAVSRVVELPQQLRKFKSEYHYLFSLVYATSLGEETEPGPMLLMPNVARRFFEVFVGIALPAGIGVDAGVAELLAEERDKVRFLRFVHGRSHGTGTRAVIEMPDLDECRAVARICVDAVRAWDERHFRMLAESAGFAVDDGAG